MLYGATGFTGGNIAVSTGVDGVAVIDDGMASVLDLLKAEIAKITDQPIDYLINTHVHGDHIGNNGPFGADGTTLVSHRNLRASMQTNGIGNGEEFVAAPLEALPVITFNDEMTLNLNGDALRLVHPAKAHTDGDAVIHFMNSNVIHTGDVMFNGLFPYIDADNGGSLDGVIAALAQELEVSSLLDDPDSVQNGFATISAMLSAGGFSLEQVQAAEHSVVKVEAEPYEALFERCVQHSDKKINCCPRVYAESGLLNRAEAIFETLDREKSDTLKLISLRTLYMHNSWMANSPTLRRETHHDL